MNNTFRIKLLFLGLPLFGSMPACGLRLDPEMRYREKQLTFLAQGHTINNLQVFSKDGKWIVYDTRTMILRFGLQELLKWLIPLAGK